MAEEKILVVDDEALIRKLLQYHLVNNGFRVVTTGNSYRVLELVQVEKPDLIILDILLPGIDGIELCREIRKQNNVPIIFLTSKNDSSDVVLGLGVGGDDYITKPFKPQEMIARVKAHLRRWRLQDTGGSTAVQNRKLKYKGLEVDLPGRSVFVNGRAVNLTVKEFDLLALLARNPNHVFTYRQLLNLIWKYENYDDKRTLLVHINRLRKKIEPDPSKPVYILTMKGVGYKFSGLV
ncbi:response regulator transcription factor [Desulfolucanica intricata]|uniref:response regulator transcription factor n=1 Tax=Desulfolucanica intricata TaxID=1285191 RepID=UPI00082E7C43|nr:response regulator transcription factor [Desulfolucanica intricata]